MILNWIEVAISRVRSRYLRTDLGYVIVLMFYSYFNADDTIIYSTNNFVRLAHYHVQHELNKVLTGCNLNQLTINTNKSKVMTFGSSSMLQKTTPASNKVIN